MPELEHSVTEIITKGDEVFFLEEKLNILSHGEQGPKGEPGEDGAGYPEGAPLIFVQLDTPTVPPGTPYCWFQTGLGVGGGGVTLWVNDGISSLQIPLITP